jgi:hypothetical protein
MLNWQYDLDKKRKVEVLYFVFKSRKQPIFSTSDIENLYIERLVTISEQRLTKKDIEDGVIRANITFKGLWYYTVTRYTG